MRRIVPHFFTFCAAVSLTVCVAVCAMWVRSYRVADVVSRIGPSAWALESNRGQLSLTYTDRRGGPTPTVTAAPIVYKTRPTYERETVIASWRWLDPTVKRSFNAAGFAWFYTRGGSVPLPPQFSPGTSAAAAAGTAWIWRRWSAAVPHWFLAAVFAVPAAIRLLRRFKRTRVGTCRNCGYDLRASPERCPEC